MLINSFLSISYFMYRRLYCIRSETMFRFNQLKALYLWRRWLFLWTMKARKVLPSRTDRVISTVSSLRGFERYLHHNTRHLDKMVILMGSLNSYILAYRVCWETFSPTQMINFNQQLNYARIHTMPSYCIGEHLQTLSLKCYNVSSFHWNPSNLNY